MTEDECWFVIEGELVGRLRALRERLNNGTRMTYDERRAWASQMDRILDSGAWMRWQQPGTVVDAAAVSPANNATEERNEP